MNPAPDLLTSGRQFSVVTLPLRRYLCGIYGFGIHLWKKPCLFVGLTVHLSVWLCVRVSVYFPVCFKTIFAFSSSRKRKNAIHGFEYRMLINALFTQRLIKKYVWVSHLKCWVYTFAHLQGVEFGRIFLTEKFVTEWDRQLFLHLTEINFDRKIYDRQGTNFFYMICIEQIM